MKREKNLNYWVNLLPKKLRAALSGDFQILHAVKNVFDQFIPTENQFYPSVFDIVKNLYSFIFTNTIWSDFAIFQILIYIHTQNNS